MNKIESKPEELHRETLECTSFTDQKLAKVNLLSYHQYVLKHPRIVNKFLFNKAKAKWYGYIEVWGSFFI